MLTLHCLCLEGGHICEDQDLFVWCVKKRKDYISGSLDECVSDDSQMQIQHTDISQQLHSQSTICFLQIIKYIFANRHEFVQIIVHLFK